MLTPALPRGEPDPQAPWTAPVWHGRSPENQPVAVALNAPTPNVGDRRRSTPARTGCPFRARLLSARRRHAMVVAHFFESASDAVYVGADREAPPA